MTRYFTEDHEWIEVEGDSATVGITQYAQSQLGDIVFAEVPAAGATLKKGGDASVSFLGGSLDGSWEFSSDKEDLILDFGFGNNPSKIMRLTNKELWLDDVLEDDLLKFEAQ